MFKIGSFEDELYRTMEKKLIRNQNERDTRGLGKIAKAIDYLNSSASIFEDVGMEEEAIKVTKILENLVNQLNGDNK